MDELRQEIEQLKRDLAELKVNRFANMTSNEVATLTDAIFQRTLASPSSGASLNYDVLINVGRSKRLLGTYDSYDV